ncbi:hypothetical protein [Cellvibrio sp. PSBB006]|uniref:hypothetical protein n=1 Tax=Cellvibrio sp. PSBB006 TaxID=1987723 RepID=UPI000B3B3C3B|nr:hypothetical protein [Cellvibrio sp. PSBB006]ARU28395.1 hypothetical protein CBR65_13640 [Cellvibrio sp. PSBB006]
MFEINFTEKSHKDLVISFLNVFGALLLKNVEEVIKQAVAHCALNRNIKIRDRKMKELSPSKQILLCVSLLLINIIFNVVIPNPNPW